MRHFGVHPQKHVPVPRGIATSGPAVLSYGFRPFFLLAGTYAVSAMLLWIGALSGLWPVGGGEGPIAWHAHEMLFGYSSAALAGFVLTAVPNWTGRLPLSGRPLATLCALWLLGRLASLSPQLFGSFGTALLDSLFLPVLALAVAREVITGRNWQNLRVALAISALSILNIAFHVVVLSGGGIGPVVRITVAVYALLISQVGGRIIPSFTRNYLARRGAARLPAPMDSLDQAALLVTLVASAMWAIFPAALPTTLACTLAGLVQAVRLARWQGQGTWREPLLLALHIGYAFVPLGYLAIALSSAGVFSAASALHVLTVGAIGSMTLAIMTRVTRGHTGHPLHASLLTTVSYGCLLLAALARPLAEFVPDAYLLMLAVSGFGWTAAFGLFLGEHGPMLLQPRKDERGRSPGAAGPMAQPEPRLAKQRPAVVLEAATTRPRHP